MSAGILLLAKLPPAQKTISSKFIFKRKIGRTCNVVQYKVRIVTLGNLQQFPHRIRRHIRSSSRLRGYSNYGLFHSTSGSRCGIGHFLESVLLRLYRVRCTYALSKGSRWVSISLSTRKLIDGLNQKPINWYNKLSKALRKLGFKLLSSAECVFTKAFGYTLVILFVYGDDKVIISKSQEKVQKTNVYLNADFKITDLGQMRYFLVLILTDVWGFIWFSLHKLSTLKSTRSICNRSIWNIKR